MYQKIYSWFTVVLVCLPLSAQLVREEESVYKKVYDHYSDILECYYQYEKAVMANKDFHLKQLFGTIARCVATDMLPLYGNFFSRVWRNISAPNDKKFPLMMFEAMLVEDALGHLRKKSHYILYEKIADLVKSLTHIRHLVKTSLEYNLETLTQEKSALEKEVSTLSGQLKEKQADCERLRTKVARLETERADRTALR